MARPKGTNNSKCRLPLTHLRLGLPKALGLVSTLLEISQRNKNPAREAHRPQGEHASGALPRDPRKRVNDNFAVFFFSDFREKKGADGTGAKNNWVVNFLMTDGEVVRGCFRQEPAFIRGKKGGGSVSVRLAKFAREEYTGGRIGSILTQFCFLPTVHQYCGWVALGPGKFDAEILRRDCARIFLRRHSSANALGATKAAQPAVASDRIRTDIFHWLHVVARDFARVFSRGHPFVSWFCCSFRCLIPCCSTGS